MSNTGEIVRNGKTYSWSLDEINLLTVTAPDGRRKTTQLGGSSPKGLALILASELEPQGPKY
jgi:hypothetical protein